MRLLALAAVLGGLAVAPAAVSSDAQPGVRVVDRTFACSLVPRGDGTFDLDLAANPWARYEYPNSDPIVVPAHLQVSSGVDSLDTDLVSVRAGALTGISRVQPAGAYAHSRKCRATRAPVALSPKGLPYEGASWGAGVECGVPRKVLVRVQATFAADVGWRKLDANYAGGRAAVVDATVAVRTEAKRALVTHMTVKKGRNVSIRYSGRCS
jgi:hypothetical protein